MDGQNGGQGGSESVGVEFASAARTIVFLRGELEALEEASPAAQLYQALIEALEQVYWLERSD